MVMVGLGACAKHGITPPRTVATDSADQILSGMTTDITRNGLRVSSVRADSAWVYQAQQVYRLKGVTLTFYNDSTGAVVSTIASDSGRYDIRTQRLDARGHVVATSAGGRVLHTAHLVYDRASDRITSDTAFSSTSPRGDLKGSSFEADPGFKNVIVEKPRQGRMKGKPFIIPGQRKVPP